jgi:ribosomal protein L37E
VADYICTACGYEGSGRKTKRGSGRMELFIWTMLLVPGPFYSLYRRIGLKRECTHCGLPRVVKQTSPEGEIMRRKVDIELGLIQVKKPEEKKEVEGFGNTRSSEAVVTKKPVDPEQF